MKFKFCGDMDAPDWVLAEISTLSKISSVRVKMLMMQVISGLLSEQFDYAKVTKVAGSSNLSSDDVQASVAGLHFIASNSAKYDVEDSTLAKELQQLGMPKEHSDAICRSYAKDKDTLVAKLRATSLKLGDGGVESWNIDYVLKQSGDAPLTAVNLRLKGACDPSRSTALTQPISVSIPADKFQVMLHELKQARAIMEEM